MYKSLSDTLSGGRYKGTLDVQKRLARYVEVLGCPSKEEARQTMLNDYTGLGRASSYRYLQSSTTGAKPP
jgi:hypothetical protein